MNWLIITITAYFLIALEVILDKFLLSSKKISHPAIYAFYSGILSFFTVVLFPFGAHSISLSQAFFYFLAGVIFIYGVLSLFYAISKSEASRVTPVVGAVIPIFTFLLSAPLLKETLGTRSILGVVVLIVGGLFISWEFSREKKQKLFSGFLHSILAGILLALSYTIMKCLFESDGFINVFVWTRIGVAIGAGSLLLFPVWRRVIFNSFSRFKKPKRVHQNTGVVFVLNKILGGVGSIMLNFAISLGDVTIVNALISIEYAFVFILSVFFSIWMPKVFQEKISSGNLLQKISAILIIGAGIFLVSR